MEPNLDQQKFELRAQTESVLMLISQSRNLGEDSRVSFANAHASYILDTSQRVDQELLEFKRDPFFY